MFDRYTEKARRVVFFARYEASQLGSPLIEPQHLLLGVLREDFPAVKSFFLTATDKENLQKRIREYSPNRPPISSSVDLTMAEESKHILAHAFKEWEQLRHKSLEPIHLFLGILREEKSFAAKILKDYGIEYRKVRETMERPKPSQTQASPLPQKTASETRPATALITAPSGLQVVGHALAAAKGEPLTARHFLKGALEDDDIMQLLIDSGVDLLKLRIRLSAPEKTSLNPKQKPPEAAPT